ncbi:MAG: hypothetical protein ACLFPU_01850 [Dehalococcoidia bacterium]
MRPADEGLSEFLLGTVIPAKAGIQKCGAAFHMPPIMAARDPLQE